MLHNNVSWLSSFCDHVHCTMCNVVSADCVTVCIVHSATLCQLNVWLSALYNVQRCISWMCDYLHCTMCNISPAGQLIVRLEAAFFIPGETWIIKGWFILASIVPSCSFLFLLVLFCSFLFFLVLSCSFLFFRFFLSFSIFPLFLALSFFVIPWLSLSFFVCLSFSQPIFLSFFLPIFPSFFLRLSLVLSLFLFVFLLSPFFFHATRARRLRLAFFRRTSWVQF